MAKKNTQRARLLVDPPVQWAIAFRLFLHWTIFVCVLVFLSIVIRTLLQAGSGPITETIWSSVYAQIPLIAVMMVLIPGFIYDTLKLSNRFAGPMFRLRTALANLSRRQESGKIHFRDGDFWQEAACDLNRVIEQLDDLKTENASLRRELAAQGPGASGV